ncbi:hypothetical protein HETIRDRAFT_105530 [Heterobasidion irregulare TC 32-1]|uniref:Uncharacterized protein n=1 Tax=Heterobasidion irregulare (strain TC 32-1) TaxID=747525 RepID=W4JUW3_HETIT|nr:uncharacterized protein HETIRDRAFT_105530 [Heterobasidion irregulare TC 32-1]ETW77317.1 hypothetical protein HETIRDRAFT_105530 [Heterobasidion irregulare TC 32-1]
MDSCPEYFANTSHLAGTILLSCIPARTEWGRIRGQTASTSWPSQMPMRDCLSDGYNFGAALSQLAYNSAYLYEPTECGQCRACPVAIGLPMYTSADYDPSPTRAVGDVIGNPTGSSIPVMADFDFSDLIANNPLMSCMIPR